ncbi:hypothetical protein BH11PLA2_BH11PLA2_17080 [soil metagenome]
MRYYGFGLIVLSLLVATAVGQAPKADTKKADGKKDVKKDEWKLSEVEQAVLDATNAERKDKKLEPLKANKLLTEAARAHAANMVKQNKLEHELDDKTVADRVTAQGYKYGRVGENIAWNQRDAKHVLATWMDSEGHRKNILNADYTELGVAAVKNTKGEIYWVQVFGRPRGR